MNLAARRACKGGSIIERLDNFVDVSKKKKKVTDCTQVCRRTK